MRNYLILFLLLGSFLFGACSSYNKVLKSDDYGAKFEMANELFEKGEEVNAIALYEQVYQRMPKSSEGELSYFRIGKGYYTGGDTYMAGYYLNMFAKRFPASPKAEEALFLSALCAVSESPNHSLDQDATELAISDLQMFVDNFPNSNLVDSCNNTIDRLRFKLELKEYEAVKLYSKTESYRAAVSSAITFLEDFPMTNYREEITFLLVENSFHLAKNSVEVKKLKRIDDTIERYSTFVGEFPESKYLNLANRYTEEIRKERNNFK
ncbi:MAG: outer membrane protein assembly factor BamD [Flavobacteriales bacterium]|nr:outer membrane protein assembly factor BamD [Flavobacteriales bacterium]